MLDEIINVNQIWALQASHILIVVLFQVAFLILSPFPDSTWNVDSHAHALLANVFFWYVDILLVKSFFSITYSISIGGFQTQKKTTYAILFTIFGYFLRSFLIFYISRSIFKIISKCLILPYLFLINGF